MNISDIFSKSPSISAKQNDSGITIMVKRKSRFIMKDAKDLLEKLKKAGIDLKREKVILQVKGPICSKSRAFLLNQGIEEV